MTAVPAVICFAVLGLLGSVLRGQTPGVPRPAIVVSGFEPFGGRAENASWTLAQAIAKSFPQEVRALQVPVLWGAPLTTINNVRPLPEVWIAFGEGTPEFQIEILAHNQRGMYPDNNAAQPAAPDIVSGAAPELQQRAEVAGLAEALTAAGFPTHVSKNAGRYLCEEMLYSLLHAQQQQPKALRLVLFIHVPTLEQPVQIARAKAGAPVVQRRVDAVWLEAFGKELFHALRQLGFLAQPATMEPSRSVKRN
jgi:pyroglutamyl-peptidase